MFLARVVIPILLVLTVSSCRVALDRLEEMQAALFDDILRTNDAAKKFEAVVPKYHWFIAGYAQMSRAKEMSMKSYLFSRYEVVLTQIVHVDLGGTKAMRFEGLEVTVSEIESVTFLSGGAVDLRHGKTHRLTAREWESIDSLGSLVERCGLKTDAPVVGFDKYRDQQYSNYRDTMGPKRKP